MKNTTLLALVALTSFSASAATDLELPGERWLGKANGYVCPADATVNVEAPTTLESIGVAFETVTTDFSLDNGLLKATFTEDGATCRYSALILADNAAKTLKLVDSKAYSLDETSACALGKEVLDSTFTATGYIWKERPRPAHLTILVPDAKAETLCGEGVTHLGIDFILSGRI